LSVGNLFRQRGLCGQWNHAKKENPPTFHSWIATLGWSAPESDEGSAQVAKFLLPTKSAHHGRADANCQAVMLGNFGFCVLSDKNSFRHRLDLPMKSMIDLPGGAGHLMFRFRIKIMATMDRLP